MNHLPRAILIAFPIVLAAGKAANIVADAGLNRRASFGVLQLLPPQATACDGGFLSSGVPLPSGGGALSVGAADQRQAGFDSRATPGWPAESLVNAGECAIAREAFKTGSPDRLLSALIAVESGGDPHAIGDNGRAVGILQIWPITVADANRILGRDEFTLADRLDPDRSRAIFYTITNHYSAGCTDEIKAKRWCNGPRGEHKPGSAAYWAKVQEAMK